MACIEVRPEHDYAIKKTMQDTLESVHSALEAANQGFKATDVGVHFLQQAALTPLCASPAPGSALRCCHQLAISRPATAINGALLCGQLISMANSRQKCVAEHLKILGFRAPN